MPSPTAQDFIHEIEAKLKADFPLKFCPIAVPFNENSKPSFWLHRLSSSGQPPELVIELVDPQLLAKYAISFDDRVFSRLTVYHSKQESISSNDAVGTRAFVIQASCGSTLFRVHLPMTRTHQFQRFATMGCRAWICKRDELEYAGEFWTAERYDRNTILNCSQQPGGRCVTCAHCVCKDRGGCTPKCPCPPETCQFKVAQRADQMPESAVDGLREALVYTLKSLWLNITGQPRYQQVSSDHGFSEPELEDEGESSLVDCQYPSP